MELSFVVEELVLGEAELSFVEELGDVSDEELGEGASLLSLEVLLSLLSLLSPLPPLFLVPFLA